MRTKYFKYIFIIFAIAIMIFAIVKIKKDEQKKENTTNEKKKIQQMSQNKKKFKK